MMIPKFLVQLSLVVVLTACTNLPTSVTTTTYSPNHASTSEVDHTATQLPEPTATPSPSPSPNPTSTQTPEPTPTPNQVELAKEQAASSLGNSANWEINTLFYDGQIIGELNQDGKLVISYQGENSEIFQHNISINQLAIDDTDLYVNGYEDVKGFGFYTFGYDREGGWKALDTSEISSWTQEAQAFFNSYSRDDTGLKADQIAENDAQDERFDKMLTEARKVRATQIQKENAQLYQEVTGWMAGNGLISNVTKDITQMKHEELLIFTTILNAQKGKPTTLSLTEIRSFSGQVDHNDPKMYPVTYGKDPSGQVWGWWLRSNLDEHYHYGQTTMAVYGKDIHRASLLTDSAIGELFALITLPGGHGEAMLMGIKDRNGKYQYNVFLLPGTKITQNNLICRGVRMASGANPEYTNCPEIPQTLLIKTSFAANITFSGQFTEFDPTEIYKYLKWSKDNGFAYIGSGTGEDYLFTKINGQKYLVNWILHQPTGLLFFNAIIPSN